MKRVADALFHFLKIAVALCLAVMVVVVFLNVVLRYAFNTGISVSEELPSWLLTYVTYLAALIALREHGHLGFDAFVAKLPEAGQRLCLTITQLMMIAVTAMFLHGSWKQTLINLDAHAPASGLSQGWLYGIGLLFSVVAIVILLSDLYRTVTGKAKGAELVMVESEGGEALAEAERHKLELDEREVEAAAHISSRRA